MTTAEKVRAHIQLVRELSGELAAYLYTLPDDVWRYAEQYGSPCEQWKVADVVTHLISGASMYSLSLSRAIKDEISPPMGYRQRSAEEVLESLVSLRISYYDDLFPEFNASCRRINTLLIDLKPDDYEKPVWHPFTVIPISRLIDYRILELAVHGWDIRYPFDREAKLNPKAVPFLKDWMWRWFRIGFQKGDALESPVRYRFDLSDSKDEGYDVVVTGDNFNLKPADDSEADVTFKCDSDTYILFGLGRLPFRRSVRRGRMAFEGDEELAAKFTDVFRPV